MPTVVACLLCVLPASTEGVVASGDLVLPDRPLLQRRLEARLGETVSGEYAVPGQGPVWVTVRLEGRSASYDIQGPSGTRLVPGDRSTVYVDQFVRFEDYLITLGASGKLTVTLQAGWSGPADLRIGFSASSGYRLQRAFDPNPSFDGDEVAVTTGVLDAGGVWLRGPLLEIEGTLTGPDGSVKTFEFLDDGRHGDGETGDGRFGRLVRFAGAGVYRVLTRATFAVDGRETRLAANGYQHVRLPSGPRFTGEVRLDPLDAGGDGLLDALALKVGVQYPKGARIVLQCVLEDAGGHVIDPDVRVSAMNPVQDGSYSLDLTIPGQQLVACGRQGPWVLRGLRIWDANSKRIVDQLPAIKTPQFDLDRFEPPPPPSIHNVRVSQDGLELIVTGRDFLGATAVSVDGEDVPFQVRRHYNLAKGEIAIRRPESMTPDRWAQIRERAGEHRIAVRTPWGVGER